MSLKNIKIIISIFLIGFILSSCKKDTLVTTSKTILLESGISGYVEKDIDDDKIGDLPLREADVYLIDSTLLAYDMDDLDSLIISQGTNPDVLKTEADSLGYYEFSSVPAFQNKFLIAFVIEEYDLLGKDFTPDGDIGEEVENYYINISLEEDELDDGNNFVVILPDVSISGTLMVDETGDDIGDSPLAYKNVILHLRENDLPTDIIAYATSDENGAYKFRGIEPGKYILKTATISGYENVSGSDDTPDPDGAGDPLKPGEILVDLEEGELDADNKFVLKIIPIQTNITGQVLVDVDNDMIGDLPVSNHRVELYFRNESGFPINSYIAESNTNINGWYNFDNLEPGEYVIYHIGDGMTPAGYNTLIGKDFSPEPGEPTTSPSNSFIAVDILDISQHDEDNIFLFTNEDIVQAPGRLEGMIYEDITSDGQPDLLTDLIIDIEIYERDANGFPTGPVLYSTTSNSDGSYVFDEIEPGDYVVALDEKSNDFYTIYGNGSSSGGQPQPDKFPITIIDGTELLNSYFWISTTNNIPSISGNVFLDTDGDGIKDDKSYVHNIELYARGTDGLPTGDIIYKTGSNSGGSFYFTNLASGDYVLKLSDTLIFGTDTYHCIHSSDDTPESGEALSNNGCTYIAVDFQEGVQDEDNNYLVEKI